jgi:hypothetical protein
MPLGLLLVQLLNTVEPAAPGAWLNLRDDPRVRVDRVPAGGDTDTATARTVDLMARFIRESAADPHVVRCAENAWRRFGQSIDTPAAKAWAVFWWVKHVLKFRIDEATMFRIGERDEQDLLISPAVLLRMQNPAEDCDGFSMVVAAMLTALKVPVVIATVAVDPRDRSRWSHVFPCALLPGGVAPLDASHMVGPGHMVPLEHISRWQTWDLEGRKTDIEPARHQGLHGYRRSSQPGLGDVPASMAALPLNYKNPATGSDWSGFIQDMIRQGVAITSNIVTPPAYQQTTRDAAGNLVSTTVRNANVSTAATAAASGLSNPNLPIYIGVGVLGLVLLMGMKNR